MESNAAVVPLARVLTVLSLGGMGGFILGRRLPPFPDTPDGTPFTAERRPPPAVAGPDAAGPPSGRGRGGLAEPGGLRACRLRSRRGLADDLQIDARQRARFRTVRDEHRGRLEQVHREARDRFDAELRELQESIRARLRPDQVQRFNDFLNGRRP
jgi:hypothetical protein